MNLNRRRLAHTAFRRILAVVSFCLCAPASAIDLADTPLFLTVDIPPNLILTLDDSGSMSRAFTPDLCGNPNDVCDNDPDARLNHRYVKAAHFNPLFYNPKIKYEIPKDANGNDVNAGVQTSFSAAYHNGFDRAYGSVNMNTGYRPSAGLHISGTGTKKHRFMNHYLDGDVRCNNTASPRRCQYSTDKGSSWTNMSTATPLLTDCSGSNNTARNQSCQSQTMPAYYYVFDTSVAGCSLTSSTSKTDNACYKMVLVSETSGPGTLDLNGDGVITEADKDERQNFAIWYSYYRTRNLMTISASARAFATVPETTRVGWQGLGTCRGSASSFVTSDCEGWQTTNPNFTNAIRPFTGTHRSNFYSWLFRLPMISGTPLRTSLKRTGDYLTVDSNTVAALTDTPYDHFTESYPAAYLPISCRKNFHILMTDGVWSDSITTGNYDNETTTLPVAEETFTSYTAMAPFKASQANTLADIAFRYWITDLSSGTSGLANSILPNYKDRSGTAAAQYWNPVNNPATWQHMVNFTVGLGLSTFLEEVSLTYGNEGFGGSYPAIKAGDTEWPSTSSDGGKIADLWHAAINSRGKFFSADDPQALNEAFTSIIRSVRDSTPSAASLAANSTQWQEGSVVFQAKFNSRDWSGNFLALPVSNTGQVGSPYWDAANLLPAIAARKLYTLNGTTGQEVTCTGEGDFQTALKALDDRCSDRLNWIKGDTSKEARFYHATTNPTASFRNRLNSKLGDIINSDPMYVKTPDFGYQDSTASSFTEKSSYAAFSTAQADRIPVVYVGGNDGILHAIRADTGVTGQSGKELFGYIPKGVYGNLAELTDQTYGHRFYVDGAPMAGDAYFGSAWHTVLVGGLNAGGKSIYALDITNPLAFGPASILWEFADADDLGFTYAQPQIGRLNNGNWVAVFGNGYNSTNGLAYLYVVDISNGDLLAKIAAGTDTDNGLSTPILWDSNGDMIADAVFAGDLKGNLWRFDLSGALPTDWVVGNSGLPLFIAENSASQRQPITAQPKVTFHPQGGELILFGTGKYLGDTDISNNDIQTFYAIRDHALNITVQRSELQQQTIDNQGNIGSSLVRVTSANTVDYAGTPPQHGWYMDLKYPASSTTGGERVVATASFLEDRVIFTTIIPSVNPCAPGGESWLMEVQTISGQRPVEAVLDANGDGTFTTADNYGSSPVSGVASNIGMIKVPAIIKKGGSAFKILTGTSGGFMTVTNKITPPGPGTVNRIYWRQIQ